MNEYWPDWLMGADNASELARYVDASRVAALVPADCRGSWDRSEGLKRATQLYDALRGHRIVYSTEPWNPARFDDKGELAYQRVRGPNETIQGPATCLDLALVFAGMAIAANIRPFIGLRTGDLPHAIVVLDLTGPLTRQARSDDRAGPPFLTEQHDNQGVWIKAGETLGEDVAMYGRHSWLIIDIEKVARHFGRPEGDPLPQEPEFRLAQQILRSRRGSALEWTLVDVDTVLSRKEQTPYRPPTDASLLPIYHYLPTLPAFRAYQSRAAVLGRLFGIVGPQNPAAVVVLHGPWGYGKSMLAHRLAVAADHGCGWFLNATDARVLTTALAQAERQEKEIRGDQADAGRNGEKPDPGEDRALASAALDRLRDAQLPWVVVLDNCDEPPEAPGLQELVPRPRLTGQFVIITTTHEGWREFALQLNWQVVDLPGLEHEDLKQLSLPTALDTAVAGRPLVAQALAAIRDHGGAELPGQGGEDGPGLVWDLVRASQHTATEAIAVARILAWCPPEAMDVGKLISVAGSEAGPTAGNTLAGLRLATPSFPETGVAIQMHRRLAAAVRLQTWRDDSAAAANAIERLLTTEAGRRFFIDAADTKALGRLEGTERGTAPGEVAKAAGILADPARVGLLWHGLAYVRERRGPVPASAPHFARAVQALDKDMHPFEVAESLIGQARVVFQNGRATNEHLTEARNTAEEGGALLARLTGKDARQMREQSNALAWLIAQKLAERETKPRQREALLAGVRENLWLSYQQRVRIVRDVPGDTPVSRKHPPESAFGLGAERAYYNLAGVNIQLAKTHHALAREASLDADERGKMTLQIREDLDQAGDVYAAVRSLREARYGGRAHPHLASCVHGQALVAYYRAVLLGRTETGRLAEAFEFSGAAMEQRRKVASGLAGPDPSAALSDPDLGKSIEFTIKVAIAGTFGRYSDPAEGAAAAFGAVREALAEWLGRPD